MKLTKTIFFLFLAVVLAGCATPKQGGNTWRPAAVDSTSGKVIAMWVKEKQGDRPVVVINDYGMLILWMEKERGFFLFNNKTGQYFGTVDFDVFLKELGRMPRDITLEWIDTCTVPRFWKMPQEAHERLAVVLANGNRRTETQFHACYCESEGLKYPEAEQIVRGYRVNPSPQR